MVRHLTGLFAVTMGAGLVGGLWLAAASPADDDVGSGTALARHVSIRRDTFGIPHILAETEEAAAFGFGYAQAEDHAVEIARLFIRARGQEARYFGRSGIENDVAMRRFDNYEEAKKGLNQVSALYRRIVRAYAAGVNRYVEQHRKELPDWVPVLTDADVLANSRAGAASALASPAIGRRLDEKYGGAKKTTGMSSLEPGSTDVDLPGSNAFALAGTRTTSGSPILVGNPHLSWSSLYWEAQVTVPGKIDFFGSTLVGIPVLRAGFNEHLGFVQTNNAPDLDDLFALPLDPAVPDHYLFEGKSRPLSRREVTIDVKADDGSLTTERRVYWSSHLGPIVHRTADKAFAVKSTRLEAHRYFEGFYRLSRSRDLNEFLDNMRRNLVPTSNFTYADARGNILYLWNGQVPKRLDDGTDYGLDVPGDTRKYVWTKLHKVDALPRLLNPRGGYIQNANNPPWYTSLGDRLDPAHYPSYFEHGPLALRPQLMLDMLESQEKFSVDDVRQMKFTTRMLVAERVAPDLVEALERLPSPSDEARSGLEALQAWDKRVSADSRGAVLFQRFWDTYSGAVPQPFAVAWSEADPAKTPRGLADPALGVRHLEAAVRWTRERYGSERVPWGEVHRFRFAGVDLPGDGATAAYGCYRVLRYQQMPDGKQVAGWIADGQPLVGFGDAWVLLVQFSKPVVAWSVLAYGQTAASASPHSRDQIGIFAQHQLRPVWFTDADIKAHTERTYRPEP